MRTEHLAIAHAIMGREVETAGKLQRDHLYRTRRIVLANAVSPDPA